MSDVKELPVDVETRFLHLEVRASKRSDDQPVIEGVAAVVNQETTISNWFREMIAPGAFKRVISENQDVIGCFNHDWGVVLGRTTAKTLRIVETAEGLEYSIDVNPNDPEALSVYAKVQRGDVSQSSFAFRVGQEEWYYPENEKELPLRTIKEVSELIDVCPVTFPAYPQTSAAVRSKFQTSQEDPAQPHQAASGDAEGVKARQKARRRELELTERK